MVPKADGDHLLAVRGAQIETVGRGLLAQLLLLELHDLYDGLLHRIQHVRDRILFLPRIFGALVSEVGHVQGRRMLRVRAAQNVGVGVETEQVGHIAADAGEIGDGTVMHEDVATEDEGVAVDLCHDATTGCADMGEHAVGLGVVADVAEIEIINRWSLRLVQSGSMTLHALDIILSGRSVP